MIDLNQDTKALISNSLSFTSMANGIVLNSLARLDSGVLYGAYSLMQTSLNSLTDVGEDCADINALEDVSGKMHEADSVLQMIAEEIDDSSLWGASELFEQAKAQLDEGISKVMIAKRPAADAKDAKSVQA